MEQVKDYTTEIEWVVTDPSCNQMMQVLGENVFRFKEERLDHLVGVVEEFSATIDLSEYTQEQMFEDVSAFGYSFNEMCTWIDEGHNLEIIAECIFEMM